MTSSETAHDARGAVVVFVTCPPGESEALARALVGQGVAACVNIIPGVCSVFSWQDQLQSETECLLVIKSTRQAFPRLRDCVVNLHSYDVPEVIAIPIEDGYKPYMDWLNSQVKPGECTEGRR